MTQIATVEKILRGGRAEISVPRKSACGHDCESCSGCGMQGSSTHAVPIVLFLIGYFASYALTSEGLRYAVAIAAFCLGIVPAILYDRKLKREGGLAFTIIRTL